MIERVVRLLLVGIVSAAGLGSVGYLLLHDPVPELAMSVPGMDGRPAVAAAGAGVNIGESFRAFGGAPSAIDASWPRFRGAATDNASREAVPLLRSFGPGEPRLLWSVELGEGHAGAAVANGMVYVLDYDESRQADALRCFSLEDGREVWRRWYTVRLKRNHGFSRTVPAVTDRFALTIGPACHVMCVDALTGELRWGLDVAERWGAEVPLWYTGQCPLIDGPEAVIAVGGSALLAGVELESGRVSWETPNPRGLRTSHSSVMPMTVAGERMYVYATPGAVVGVSAEPERRGALLWESTDFDATVIAPSPVDCGGGRIFVTAGYGAGSIMLEVTRGDDGSFSARTLYRRRPSEGFACEHQTPVLIDGMLVGILPKDAGARRSELACWHPEGRWVWSSGPTARFGLGPYLLADGMLLVLGEDGVLVTAEASTAGYRPLGSARILDGPDAWAPLALAQGRLIARDSRRMVCVDMRRRD